MEILLTAGIGEGKTDLSAFDRALFEAGIGNVNLIPLSSVIPIGATLVDKKPELADDQWGHKLYVVLAQHRELAVGGEAWAGIGWVQDADDGAGLFVEHHGGSRAHVESQISESLESMVEYRPDRNFSSPEMKIVGVVCHDRPVCALVAAVYEAEGWARLPAVVAS